MADLRPGLAAALRAFGAAATVTLPGEEPVTIDTTVIWLPPMAVETPGVLGQTNSPQAILALSKADVPSAPRGTLIEAPAAEGGANQSWVVEAVLGELPDEIRVLVIPAEAA